MKGLIIKPKWGNLILNGEKTVEIRSSNTYIRGEIGIIKSGSKKVFGTVELYDCVELNEELFNKWRDKHKVECNFNELSYKHPHAWLLREVKRYPRPIAYQHKVGCVIWVNI